MNIIEAPLSELKEMLDNGDISAVEIVRAFRENYERDEREELPLNGYIEFFDDAEKAAQKSDQVRESGDPGILEGLPIAVKDNILISGHEVTCGSAILEGFKAPYSSTVVERLRAEGMIFLGRTNMDEFAMGSTCEYSVYGPSRNPYERNHVTGGSSGGSACVVSAAQAPVALGSETGGSVRLPASFCGIYGLKPTYGSLSRYGLVAFGSSLDQIGILGRVPDDIALVLSVAGGYDPNDSTSANVDFSGIYPLKRMKLKGKRVAIPVEISEEGVDEEIRGKIKVFSDWLTGMGVTVEKISLPVLKLSVAIYYIIAPAEASSNLSRFDGIKYGFRDTTGETLEDLYVRTRTRGFGEEVKRRIFIGNYVLSSGYYDEYYKKAMEVRRLLKGRISELFTKYDFILSPTSPVLPFRIGEKVDDPLSLYLTDICTTFANLASIPALSVPLGLSKKGLPIGLQIAGNMFEEEKLLRVAKLWHEESNF